MMKIKNIQFIIWSPPYSNSSGGIMCLHMLARDLSTLVDEVWITTPTTIENSDAKTIPTGSDIIFDPLTTMIIYPEIVTGNPLNGKHITRWLLNTPGVCGGDGIYGETDLVYKYWDKFLAPDETKVCGFLRTLDAKLDIAVDKNLPRSGECFLIHKGWGKELNKHNQDAVNVQSFKLEDTIDLFNKKERFISYDTATYYSVLAALCGCISIVIPDEGLTKDQFRKNISTNKYGIAYGLNDIEHAQETHHLVREHIQFLQNECEELVKNYLTDCIRHIKNS
jgi:hypothetical protein